MLTSCDDPNTQKQLRRSEQLKKWNERELMNLSNEMRQQSQNIMDQKHLFYQRTTKVRFPKGCVFLAACSSGDIDEVRAHLKLGVNINTTNIDGLTALHQACIDANIEMVRFLVENNADINAQDNEGWTPLHAAVSVGNLDVSKYLINKGAKLNICNNDSDLPIDLCDTTNTQMKEFLDDEMQQQGIDADYERRKEELIMYEDAKKMNFDDKIQLKTGATALHVSAAKGYTRVLKILIQSGANVNALDKDGWTPLHAAAHWEQEEACKILAESGAEFSIKTYSDQSVFDVCDADMVAKLKQLEANSKKQTINLVNNLKNGNSNSNDVNTLTDVTSMNNQLNGDNQNRRNSDELNNKTTIVRLTNEAKSTLSDKEKKQEKNLLSPIANNNKSNTNNFDLNNSETEHEKTSNVHKQPNSDKENRNNLSVNSSNVITNTNQLNDQLTTRQQQQQQQQQQSFTKPTTKTGLHESLKSLSAQVRMMEEDKDEMSDQNNGFKRKSKSNDDGNTQKNTQPVASSTLPVLSSSTTSTSSSSPTPTPPPNISTSITINNLKNSNSSPKVTGTNDQMFNNVISSPNSQSSDNRRYSTAPVASKDEQAELIRKQKAKLERHFRRSTTAVSYEDIKSAEATIKGTGSNSNLFKTEVENLPNKQQTNQESTSTSTSSSSSSVNAPVTQTLSLPQSNNINIYNKSLSPSVPVNSGVSSLSTLFGEPIKSNTMNHSNTNSHNSTTIIESCTSE